MTPSTFVPPLMPLQTGQGPSPSDRPIIPLMSLNINNSSSSFRNSSCEQSPVFSSAPTISKSEIPLSKTAPLPVQPKRTLEELGIKLDHLSPEQQIKVRHLIEEYSDVFATSSETLRDYASEYTCRIGMKHDAKPVHMRNFKHSVSDEIWIQNQVDEWEKHGIVRKCLSFYNSPLLIVSNAAKQSKRLCVDLRMVNSMMTPLFMPTIKIDDIAESLAETNPKFFCSWDLLKGYLQVNVHELDQEIFSFSTKQNHFCFRKLPFGAQGSGAIFQQILQDVFKGLAPSRLLSYVDDVLLHSHTFEHMLETMKMAFQRLREHRFYLNAAKCEFMKPSVTFLGFIISEKGIAPRPDRIKALLDIKPPQNARQIKSILGSYGFYRRHIRNYSLITNPINILLRKGVPFHWSKECQAALDLLKEKISHPPILAYPQTHKECTVMVDSSGSAVSYIVTQQDESNHPCLVDSGGQSLSPAQRNWPIIEQESFALILCLRNNAPLLKMKPFSVFSDNLSVVFLKNIKQRNSRLLRFSLLINEFIFSLGHVAGKKNYTDAISRYVDFPPTPDNFEDEIFDKITLVSENDQKTAARVADPQNVSLELLHQSESQKNISQENISQKENMQKNNSQNFSGKIFPPKN